MARRSTPYLVTLGPSTRRKCGMRPLRWATSRILMTSPQRQVCHAFVGHMSSSRIGKVCMLPDTAYGCWLRTLKERNDCQIKVGVQFCRLQKRYFRSALQRLGAKRQGAAFLAREPSDVKCKALEGVVMADVGGTIWAHCAAPHPPTLAEEQEAEQAAAPNADSPAAAQQVAGWRAAHAQQAPSRISIANAAVCLQAAPAHAAASRHPNVYARTPNHPASHARHHGAAHGHDRGVSAPTPPVVQRHLYARVAPPRGAARAQEREANYNAKCNGRAFVEVAWAHAAAPHSREATAAVAWAHTAAPDRVYWKP